ncbi:MAG: hypothetical protein IPH61_09115 [Bacteroidetes bacterium]|nr:hypothetical protein [Bacteroidota bacterium]
MNNTSVTAMMINPAMSIARRTGTSYSKVLMPLAYASIVGGTCTLIGTSTNVAVNAYLSTNGYETLGMFDFTSIGIVMVVITIIYLSFLQNIYYLIAKQKCLQKTMDCVNIYVKLLSEIMQL